jgi:hypothetical protein
MASPTKNVLSLISLLILSIGTFSTVMIILSDNNVVQQLWGQDYYKMGSALAGALVVIILIYLTATSLEKSITYKTIIISVLIIGLIAEIIMNFVSLGLEYEEESKYALVVFNFLYRAYYLISYVQEPWAEMTLETVNKGIKTVTSPLTTSSAPASTDDSSKAFKDKWVEIRAQARSKYGADNLIESEANGIINRAASAGTFDKGKYSEALAALKTKSGEAVTGIPIGGRRKVRR